MNLSELCIRRPVFTLVINLLVVLLGVIGLFFLGIREFPTTDRPVISVTTNYTGANAQVIESQITEPLEEYISGIDGIRQISSISREERSTISVEFELGVDLNDAANNVIEKVTRSLRQLPPDADPPIVAKEDDNNSPIIFLNVQSSQRTPMELTEVADRIFKQQVQTIRGVSLVPIWGSQLYSMRLWLDRERMAAQGITPRDVQQAVARENVELPGGRVEGNSTELTVRTLGRLETVEAFNDLPIRQVGQRTIRLRDIGRAALDAENQRTRLKRDGIQMVGVALYPQPGANHLEIANEFYNRLNRVRKDLPADIQIGIGFDTTRFIAQAIDEVTETLFVAFALVTLIIFLFLRDWRTTLIPVLAIPISLVGSFFVMYLMGFSINILTLLSLVLAIGIVVDDAIVMMENIYSRIERGEPTQAAAIAGSREVFFAIIATTISLVVVFLPVLFLQGLVGRLFFEFGVVLAVTVLISGFVSLTLTPMASSRLLRPLAQHNWLYRKTEPLFIQLNEGYGRWLEAVLARPWLSPVLLAASLALFLLLGSQLKSELAPMEDRSRVLVNVQGPEGATYEYMDRYMDALIDEIRRQVPPGVRDATISVTSPAFGANSSANSGFMFVNLLDPARRRPGTTQAEVADRLSQALQPFTGARTTVIQQQTFGGRFGAPVEYVLKAPSNEALRAALDPFLQRARRSPHFAFVDVNLKLNKPELTITPDRQRARDLDVSVRDIGEALQLGLSGSRYGFFQKNGKQYQVIGQLQRTDRDDPADIRSLYVANAAGKLVQLDNVVTTQESATTPSRFRYERYPSATFSANPAPGYTLGEALAEMDRIAAEVLPENFQTSLSGTSRDFQDSNNNLLLSFVLALVLVYLVLAAQFESWRDPVIILLNVATALMGAVLSLWYFHQTLNIFSQIGIIRLIGLVTKNGILIVEFANQRRRDGHSRLDAVREAAVARFRPILMTSLCTALGFLPIALALGAGAESRIGMGIAVVGGVSISSFLSLFLVPGMYLLLSRGQRPPATVAMAPGLPDVWPETRETATTPPADEQAPGKKKKRKPKKQDKPKKEKQKSEKAKKGKQKDDDSPRKEK
ncbi:MAG: efflux RND transporter permease subunit [Sphingobacteriia bacterium]